MAAMPGRWRSLVALPLLFLLLAAAAPPVPADLAPRYRDWLEEVAPLLSAREREAFLALGEDYRRDAFIRRFWEVRDPFPQTARNEFQERWEERVELARERFGNLAEDRARMLLLNGPPARIYPAHCADVLLPLEIWDYDGTEAIKGSFSLVFVSPQGGPRGPFRLWYPSEGLPSLLALEARVRAPEQVGAAFIADACPQGQEILGRLAAAIDWSLVESKGRVVPTPDPEWLAAFQAASTDVPAGAAPLPAALDLTYPGRFGSRTVVQALVSVAKEQATVERLAGNAAYTFVVDGEVLHKEELFEHFRYRFTLPAAEAAAGTIPLVFQRYLRPGSYTLVLKVEDVPGKRYFRDRRDLAVPAVEEAAAAVPAPGVAAAAPAAPVPASGAGALAEANAAIRAQDQTIRFLPPEEGLKTGRVRVEAVTTGDGVARVRFELNGRPVLTKARPPYSVELSLGEQPRLHTVRAFALAADGRTLAEDQVLLNAGPHRFSVHLLEPQPGRPYKESVRAQAEVNVPEGETLDRVEFYRNETLVATLYQPPFVQPILIPPGQDVAYVRAVARLADGNATEDLVMVNQPDYGERIEVQFVELFATVVDRRGHPVEGLGRDDFKVIEDGVEQKVRRFELVRDLPIYAGVMIDTSASMSERLGAAVSGALRFFHTVITPRDRAALVTFNDKPNLAVRFTNREDVLAGGVAGLTADGETAIYDSLIYTLYYFGGIKGKRAIVLLTDGDDTKSRHPFNEALEYARRSGVALYTVGISLSTRQADVRGKLERLAEETGGRAFFIDGAGELERVYATIQKELRSQYLLAYQSSNEKRDDRFRAVEVKVARPGLEVKTLRGYYP
jgi:VWFA-related protein